MLNKKIAIPRGQLLRTKPLLDIQPVLNGMHCQILKGQKPVGHSDQHLGRCVSLVGDISLFPSPCFCLCFASSCILLQQNTMLMLHLVPTVIKAFSTNLHKTEEYLLLTWCSGTILWEYFSCIFSTYHQNEIHIKFRDLLPEHHLGEHEVDLEHDLTILTLCMWGHII